MSDWSSDVCSSDLLEAGAAAALVGHAGQHPAELPDLLELGAEEQELLVPSRRGVDVDGRVDPALGEAAIEAQLHVAGALDLLEDHLVLAAPGLSECGGEDVEPAPFPVVGGDAEELLGREDRPGFVAPQTAGDPV